MRTTRRTALLTLMLAGAIGLAGCTSVEWHITDTGDGAATSTQRTQADSNGSKKISNVLEGDAAGTSDVDTTWNEAAAPDMWLLAGNAQIDDTCAAALDMGGGYVAADESGYVAKAALRVTSDTIAYGKRERADISDADVRGWPKPNQKASVTFASGKTYNGYFWNRSHLIAHMLGGEDEDYNLITGTRAQNVGDNAGDGGMQHCEWRAYNYVCDHEGIYVDYVATPVYNDGESIPRAVVVDMKSSDGGLDERYVVYNAMPGYTIDYVTGEATAN